MLDLKFSESVSKLNFIGVVSLFGGEIAISSLRYTVLIRNKFLSAYFTMVVSPGLQTVSLKMFKQMDDRVSKAISGGSREDRKEIIGLSAGGGYRYVGIHSGTKMTVGSILGESLIGAIETTGPPIDIICSRKIPQKRNLKLKVIELDMTTPIQDKGTGGKSYGPSMWVSSRPFGIRSIFLYVIPLITVAGIIIVLLAEDYEMFVLIVLNVICNMLITITTRSNGIKYPIGKAAEGCPPGDIFIETSNGDDTYLVIANEDVIQYLFQKPLIMPPNPDSKIWTFVHVLTAYLSYVAVLVNIILFPFSTTGGQIIFGVLIFFGVVQNIILSTFDGSGMMLEAIRKYFTIKPATEYIFQTRSTLVAFCMIKSGCKDARTMKHLLPSTDTFNTWYENVLKVVDGIPINTPVDDKLLANLNLDLQDAFDECNKCGLEIIDKE
jgi:hypothetical protein